MTTINLETPAIAAATSSPDHEPPSAAKNYGPAVAACIVAALFCWSFLAAFSSPSPQGLDVTVVGPPDIVEQLSTGLSTNAPGTFDITASADGTASRDAVASGDIDAAVMLDPNGTATIFTASAGGPATASAVEGAMTAALTAAGVDVIVEDLVGLPARDSRGNASFFFIVSITVPAVVFAVSSGLSNPGARLRRRFGSLAVFAAGVGVVNSTIAHLIAFDGHWWETATVGAAVAIAIGGASIVLQRAIGTLAGSAVALGVFVLFGLPATGGPIGASFMPDAFRTFTDVLPTTAGVDVTRAVLYFDSANIGSSVTTLVIWGAIMVAAAGVWDALSQQRPTRRQATVTS